MPILDIDPGNLPEAAGTLYFYREGLATSTGFSVTTAGAITSPGALSTTGDTTITSGDLTIATAGNGLNVKEGTNATMGTLTLNGATPVVTSTTAVTANSRIFLTANTAAGTPAHFWVSARTAGTSFSVTGTAGDTSVVAWLIVEPAA